MRQLKRTVWVFLLAIGCGTVAGNPGERDDDDDETAAVAPVRFALTDASVDGAKSVLINVESLEVSLKGESWISIPLTATAQIDLLQFQDGLATDLGALPELPVGTYEQTRLKLKDGSPSLLVLDDDTEHELTIPSAEQTGIKITTPFTVEAGKELNLTIDFDLRKSIKKTGSGNGNGKEKYMMKPVLRLVRDDGTGTITGSAADGKVVCVFAAGGTISETDECDDSVNSGKVKNGAFKIAYVPAGTYDLRVFRADGTHADVTGVVVTAGQTIDVTAVPE